MFRSINPPIPMLLYVWEQESCTKVIPINVLSPQHGYLQPSRSKIAQSKVHVARGDQKHPSRYTGAHREKSTRGVVQEIPYRATNWRRASFSILSYIFHLRDQPFVPSQAITPGSVPRYGRAENASGAQPTGLWFCFAWCVPKISRAWIQPLRVPQASLYASLFEKGDRRYILSTSPSRTRTFSFFFFRQFLVTTKDSSLWRGLVCPRIYFDFSALLTALENSIALSTGLTNDWSLFAANQTERNLFSGEFIALRLISILKGARVQGLNTIAVIVN